MRLRIFNFWTEIRASYWFLPTLMVIAAIGLSLLTIDADRRVQLTAGAQFLVLWRGGPDGARGLMEVIAGSMMTVASLTFSLTLVAFAQASAQFGPRLLRNFIRDIGNQIVLGTFIATFVYCLLVLRAIRTGVEASPAAPGVQEFVPVFSISIGFALGLASLGVLIYFIHHVSQSIYAPNVIAGVAEDLMDTIERMFPKDEDVWMLPEAETIIQLPDGFNERAYQIRAGGSGYLQGIDYSQLLVTAVEHDVLVAVTHRPGHFVIRGDDLFKIWPPERVDNQVVHQLQTAFVIGKQRLAPQDVEFAIDQLVEVAVRALSPAINDPFTAMNCIDWLGVALARLAEKKIPPPYYADRDQQVRIVLQYPVTFEGVTEAAFNQIRQQVGNQVAVRIRLLEVIAVIAEHTQDERELQALVRQARMVQRSSHEILQEMEDVRDVDERFRQVERVVHHSANGQPHHRADRSD